MATSSARVGVDALGERHEAQLSSGLIEYFDAGSGPLLLLLHGLRCRSAVTGCRCGPTPT